MKTNYTDVIIIGAGLSGIGAACHLKIENPSKSFVILESREELGGTWSLFKYPGIRSDSDMYTFGYSFKTWDNPKTFADAPSILSYLNEAAIEHNVLEHINYNQRGVYFNFNTKDKLWTVTAAHPKTGVETIYTSAFIFSCSGYYNYDKGYTPTFKGVDDFTGQLIHPQKWDTDTVLTDKKVVVIGSGATAVTIVPEIANEVAHVTMLQRSPSYISALPNTDKIASIIKKISSKKTAHKLIRMKNVFFSMLFFKLCRQFPSAMKSFIVNNAKKKLGDFPVEPHFTPNYDPWVQRLCMCPDGDFFTAIRQKQASVVTDKIAHFVTNGVVLESGKTLEADIVISATGLNILPFGGAQINIDDKPFSIADAFVYKGLMLSGLPNFFVFIGYTNASWTLKSDLTSAYISRVFAYLEANQLETVVARVMDDTLRRTPLLNLDSGYINRASKILPSQGDKAPWRVYQNYVLDYKMLRIDAVKDKNIFFS